MLDADNLLSLEFSVRVGHLNIEFFVHESRSTAGNRCGTLPHNHHDCELRYVASGLYRQMFEDGELVADTGDFVLIPPMYYHYCYTEGIREKTEQYGIRFSVRPPSEQSKQERRAYKMAKKLLSRPRKLHDESGRILLYLKQITYEISRREQGYVSAVRYCAALVFTEMFRLFDEDVSAVFSADEAEYRGRDYLVLDEFFDKHFCLPNTGIQDCAAVLRLSTRQVDRIMYKMYGMSFVQKLKEMRIKRAAHLLKTTDKTMNDISIECGFNSYSAFHACFKGEYHMSPTEFRRS